MLSSVALPTELSAAEMSEFQASGQPSEEEILVIGNRYILGIVPERELDEQGIESYGQSTVGELLADIQGEMGEDEPPLILVNGERVDDLADVSGLPVEALEGIKILPRGSAVRAGGSTRQRVVSLTVKKQVRAATALVAHRISTDGEWSASRGEGILTYIRGATRANVTFKARSESDLLESERGIIQTDLSDPHLGDFRTLRPKTRNYDLNGTFATRLAPWLTGNVGIRLNHSPRISLRGLSTPEQHPLATRYERDSGEVSLSLNGRFGQWTSYFNARQFESTDKTRTERDAVTGVGTDHAKGKTSTSNAKLSMTGPLVALPAGPVQATFETVFARNHLRSESQFGLVSQDRTFRRSETALRGAIDVPLAVRDGFGSAIGDLNATAEFSRVHYSDAGNSNNYQLGLAWEPRPVLRLSADLEVDRRPASVQVLGNPVVISSGVRTFDPLTGETVDVTQITGGNPDISRETTTVHRIGAIVRPLERLNLQLNAEYTDRRERNFVSSLPEASAAVMLAFPERFIRDLGGTLTTVDLRPVNFDSHREKRFRYGFSLSTRLGQGQSSGARLAPSFESEPGEEGATGQESTAAPRTPLKRTGAATRISVTASHSIVFHDEIVIRPGLGTVDLLEGGAIGIGGGRLRHQLDATASISSRGVGLRVAANWRGKSTLNVVDSGEPDRLFFSPVFNLGLRAFADLNRFLPHSDWARRTRISLNVVNAANDRQEVRNSAGFTPLRYQPGYRDALGRTVEIELRKVF